MKSHKSIDKKLITICTTLPVVSTTSVLAETTGTNNIQNPHLPNFVEGELNTGINSISRDKGVDLKASLTNSYPEEGEFRDKVELGGFDNEIKTSVKSISAYFPAKFQQQNLQSGKYPEGKSKDNHKTALQTHDLKAENKNHQQVNNQIHNPIFKSPDSLISPPELNYPELPQTLSSFPGKTENSQVTLEHKLQQKAEITSDNQSIPLIVNTNQHQELENKPENTTQFTATVAQENKSTVKINATNGVIPSSVVDTSIAVSDNIAQKVVNTNNNIPSHPVNQSTSTILAPNPVNTNNTDISQSVTLSPAKTISPQAVNTNNTKNNDISPHPVNPPLSISISPPIAEKISPSQQSFLKTNSDYFPDHTASLSTLTNNNPIKTNTAKIHQDQQDKTEELLILTPLSGETTQKTTKLAIQYPSHLQATVTINGKSIDPQLPNHLQTDSIQKLNTQIWYNLPLQIGENTITATLDNGKTSTVKITRQHQQTLILLTPLDEPRVPADGRSTVKIKGQITNTSHEIIREHIPVTLTTTAGKFIGVDNDADAPGFQVMARNGEFTVELQASLEPQNVNVRAAIDNWQQQNNFDTVPQAYTNIEFITNLRPSLATGSINLRIGGGGTNYHGRFRDFLNPRKIGRTDLDLDAAVFATGKIGDWLFTGAYNSDRNLNEDCLGDTRLFGGGQVCERVYPVYGDGGTVTATTPSIDSVYARLERTPNIPGAESDYFLWGDYHTQEFARPSQLFSGMTRQLHGFKGNYNLGNLQVTALLANNIEGFVRDTIAANGTSGYYFLRSRNLVPGSENVFIESEEINRPGTVVKRQSLSRGADYEIDYERGTIMFRSRIFATELNPLGNTLTNRIVVTYQNRGGNGSKLYGGRLQYNFRQKIPHNNIPPGNYKTYTPFLATSYLWEDQNGANWQLLSVDAYIPWGKTGQIIGEYARSRHNSLALGNMQGSAYRLEATGKITPDLQAKAFYRSVSENFANNATWSFVPGQTRYGASLAGKLSSTTSFHLGYDHEDNFGIAPALRTNSFDLFNPQPQPLPGTKVDNSLTTLRAGIEQKMGDGNIGVEYINRQRQDRIDNRFHGNAHQIRSYGSIPVTASLTFHAQNELNLGQSDALYPNRTTLGLDWNLYPGVTVRLAHQFFAGGLLKGNSITSLDTLFSHQFNQDTSVTGRYSIFSGIDGMNDQAAIGLNHRIRLAPGLKLNLGYERIQNHILGNTAAGIRFAQPYTTGQTGFTLGNLSGNSYSIGLDYTDNPYFQANARVEYRDGEGGNNLVISAAAAGKLSTALTAAIRYQQAAGANQLLGDLPNTANLRFGLAYRDPRNDKFNALLGYEYRLNPTTTPETLLTGNGNGSTEHVFAAEAIYAPHWQWEFYGKYAFRNHTSYLADNFTNTSTAYLAQLRATYQLGYRTDVAVEGRWLGQPSVGFNEFAIALESGYYLTPDLRIGVGYAFGSADDRDFTGYRSAGGPYLNITYKINELFAGFGRQKPAPKQQQESEIVVEKTGDRRQDTGGD